MKEVTTMSKISYPAEGLYKYTKFHTENVASQMQRASNNFPLNIPYDFAYRKYLLSLRDTINNFYKEINQIDDKIQKADTNYNNLENSLSKAASDIMVKKITERDRMI